MLYLIMIFKMAAELCKRVLTRNKKPSDLLDGKDSKFHRVKRRGGRKTPGKENGSRYGKSWIFIFMRFLAR